jgi:pyruvate/2-oxoglutarate dehydrogenase complex dihydrolipoamide acyltransferase (E2) component
MAKMVLKLPKLAVSMREGTIARWLVEPGATVAQGQPIYELESEKSAMEVESPFAGVFTPLAPLGEALPVGTPVAEVAT